MNPKLGIMICAPLLVVLGLAMVWSAMNRQPSVSSGGGDHDIDPAPAQLNRPIPPFKLTQSNGETFDSADLQGEVWVASFFFTSCPSICKLQNQQVAILQEQFADLGVKFVSITCDPDNDKLPVLAQYAESFQAKPDTWYFLRGELDEVREISQDHFQVMFAKQNHSDRLLLVDKSGKLRGAFQSTRDDEFRQMKKMLEEMLQEPYSPNNKEHDTTASKTEDGEIAIAETQTMSRFALTDSLGQPFDSQSLEGDVWLSSFFYTSCPSICVLQNLEVAKLQEAYHDRGLKFVSITCDPENDTPAALAGYAARFVAKPDVWHFLTGDFNKIQEIGSEFFNTPVKKGFHSDRLFLVDRNGKVIDSFRSREKDQMQDLRDTLETMLPQKSATIAEGADATEDGAVEVGNDADRSGSEQE